MSDPRLIFLRVGQGDSIVLVGPDSGALLVDVPRPQDVVARLTALQVPAVAALYITHAHRDHSAPLIQLYRFIADWQRHGRVHRVLLPDGMILAAEKRWRRLLGANPDDPEGKRLRAAVESLNTLSKSGVVVDRVTKEDGPIDYGGFRVVPLHPRHVIVEMQKALSADPENLLSLVLRVERRDFRALLLADAEGLGLDELDALPPDELRADVVKIPHHGAWPAAPQTLESVLTKAKPSEAVLSVGSCNAYGHVRPELFKLLLKLRGSGLRAFLCTEVTRTCVHDAAARAGMNNQGLPATRPCAGEISVVFPAQGGFQVVTETDHAAVIAQVEMPACQGRADL